MANYKYQYNEEPAPPPKEAEEYKYYTVYPNNVLVMGILSLIFSGWLGVIFALYTLQKEKIYRREHEGETCTKVKTGKILAIVSLVILGVLAAVAIGMEICVIILAATQTPEEASQLCAHLYSLI